MFSSLVTGWPYIGGGCPAALDFSLIGKKQCLPMAHREVGTVWTKEAITHDAYSHLLQFSGSLNDFLGMS